MSPFCRLSKSKDALAILYAAETGDHRAMRVLLERGVHPDSARGRRLETPLFVATQRDHVDAVRTLLEHGADATITKEDGAGAITKAASVGRMDLIELMKDFRSDTFQEPAAVLALHQASLGAHPEVLQVLLDGGAPVDVCLPTHPPVLHSAAISCALCVEKLLQAGADPNCTDQQGRTPLHLAARAGKFDCVHVLMKAGAHVDARSVDGRLPWKEVRTERMRNLMLDYLNSRSTPPLHLPPLVDVSQSSPFAQSSCPRSTPARGQSCTPSSERFPPGPPTPLPQEHPLAAMTRLPLLTLSLLASLFQKHLPVLSQSLLVRLSKEHPLNLRPNLPQRSIATDVGGVIASSIWKKSFGKPALRLVR